MLDVVGAVRAVFAFYIGSHPHGVLLGICQVVQGGAGAGDVLEKLVPLVLLVMSI